MSLQVKAKKTRKFAAVKRMLNPKDIRLCVHPNVSMPRSYPLDPSDRKENQLKQKQKEEAEKEKLVKRACVSVAS